MNINTYYYFFSTSAQCFAGITALALVAIQMRLSFLDGIVTNAKRTVLGTILGQTSLGPIEHHMAAYSASEILKIGRGKGSSEGSSLPALCDALEKALEKAQGNRAESGRLLSGLLILMLIFLLELPFSEYFVSRDMGWQILVLAANSLLIAGGTLFSFVESIPCFGYSTAKSSLLSFLRRGEAFV